MFAVIGKKIVTRLQATAAFTTANGSNKVFPVIIPQGVSYPCSTFEITNVSNFLSKGGSLNSCDVSIRIACFADTYNTTYNQAKAAVEALDLYEVTYTEDSVSSVSYTHLTLPTILLV